MSGLINTIVGGMLVIIGGMLTPLVTHLFAREREKRTNMSDMRGFLGGLSEKIYSDDFDISNIRHLTGYYHRFYADFRFWKRSRIGSACERLKAEIQKKNKSSALNEIKELVRLL
jgi:hypothetical protein